MLSRYIKDWTITEYFCKILPMQSSINNKGNKNMSNYADQCVYDAVAFYAADETATDEMISAKAQELFEMEGPEYDA